MKRFLTITGLLLLVACGRQASTNGDQELKHAVAPDTLSARLELRILEKNAGKATIGIVIINPERVPIQSVRSWVKFDPLTMRVQDLGIVERRFALFAPGERTIDRREGFIKLGAAAKQPVADDEILFATFSVRADHTPVALTFYDWREEGDGHTALLSLSEDAIVNIVRAPSSIAL